MSRTCLVVDDSRTVRKIARRILETQGYQVLEAEDGRDALTVCRQALPNCILLDWKMPVMDGISFLRALRQEFGADNPPVVFCTTENNLDHIALAMQTGAQEYIMKPFNEGILLGKLEQVGLL